MIVMIMQQMPRKPRETPTPIPILSPLPSPCEGADVPEAVLKAKAKLVVGVLPVPVVDADTEPGAVEATPS